MSLLTDAFDLGGLRLSAGEGRRLDLETSVDPFELGGEPYRIPAPRIPVRLDISRTVGGGYALRVRFRVELTGPCMRCLSRAEPVFDVDAREISQSGEGGELESPYVDNGVLDLRGWVRDSLALTLPAQLLCRDDCAGLCPVCGADLNAAELDHAHEQAPDPRWAKLSEFRFDR